MQRVFKGIVILLILLISIAADGHCDDAMSPAKQYSALSKEFHDASREHYLSTNAGVRKEYEARIYTVSPRLLELASKNPNDPIALDALVLVVKVEIWFETNTSCLGRGKDSLEARAIELLQRNYVRSDLIAEAINRISVGFSKECEEFLRNVLEMSPHRYIRGLACMRLAQFLNKRFARLEVLKGQPDMAARYCGLFGEGYLKALLRQDPDKAVKEIESLFARAVEEYGGVVLQYEGTVGERAKSELYELTHLSIGKVAPDIEGVDQEGVRFKLSDYRGKVVLLYFWSEF